jgi:hypothetical protein
MSSINARIPITRGRLLTMILAVVMLAVTLGAAPAQAAEPPYPDCGLGWVCMYNRPGGVLKYQSYHVPEWCDTVVGGWKDLGPLDGNNLYSIANNTGTRVIFYLADESPYWDTLGGWNHGNINRTILPVKYVSIWC